ncbi:MAG: very short patch repair endonuclease [Ignavibacteria bacterium GWF2_33_9]|nr:MAG: very short patch repair endonuclease [Ignavibacteria bacterium GWF2_33_9]
MTHEQRTKNMKAVKNKGSKIELLLGRALWKIGLRYRKNDKTVFGKPDFTIKKHKLAIFCDSEFWHGFNWSEKKKEHKSNINYWHKKIERNIERDKEVNEFLEQNGWIIIRFWGKEIEKNPNACANKAEEIINGIKRKDIN